MGAKQRVEAFNAKQSEEYQSLNEKLVSRRLLSLFDEDSFIEFAKYFGVDAKSEFREQLAKDGVCTGLATLGESTVMVIAHDPEIHSGSLGLRDLSKATYALNRARHLGVPVVSLLDCAGIQIDEGADTLLALSLFNNMYRAVSEVVPTIALVYGPVVGSLALIPRLSAFTIMHKEAGAISVNGPMIVAATEGKAPDHLALAGGEVQAGSGGTDFLVDDETAMAATLADILSKLEFDFAGGQDDPNRISEELDEIAMNMDGSVDMARIFTLVADQQSFVEFNHEYASELVTGWGKLNGKPVGFIGANAETWTAAMCWKAKACVEKFEKLGIEFFNFVRGTGAEISSKAEQTGLNLALAELFKTLSVTNSLAANVIVGKVHGVMFQTLVARPESKPCLVWPSAEISLVPADTAASILYVDELKGVENPVQKRQELADRFVDECASGNTFEKLSFSFQTISPRGTRLHLFANVDLMDADIELDELELSEF